MNEGPFGKWGRLAKAIGIFSGALGLIFLVLGLVHGDSFAKAMESCLVMAAVGAFWWGLGWWLERTEK